MIASASVVHSLSPTVIERNEGRILLVPQPQHTGLDRPGQAWQWMRQTLQAPNHMDWVRGEVSEAWCRCLEDHGLRFQSTWLTPGRSCQNLTSTRPDTHPALISLQSRFEQQSGISLADAGLTLCLTNANGRLVGMQGHDISDCQLGRLLGQVDADWSEASIGNNGIGTAAITDGVAAFTGEEHYLSLLHPFSTAGYPLHDAEGKRIAILGVLIDHRISQGIFHSLIWLLGRYAEEALMPQTAPPTRCVNRVGSVDVSIHPATDLTQRLIERAVRLQEQNIPILVVGESGSGKEFLVRKAYESGPRRNGPFIAVNCASIPRDLIESELFGYAAGSFTGARKEGKAGKFQLADKGVLLLDEIGDMSLDLQAVLLRVLENSEFYPVGGSEPIRVDVQIFAATNVPIKQAVNEGRFRRDLYYRLNGAQLILPALRKRDDRADLIQRILTRELLRADRPDSIHLSTEVMDVFLRHPWPGNVRQLSNVLRSALHLAENEEINLGDLPEDFFEELNESGMSRESTALALAPATSAKPDEADPQVLMSLSEWERKGIKIALEFCKGNLTKTAKALGITRGTLYKKMGEYNLSAR